MLGTDFIVQVQLYLGFHISLEVNVYLRQIVHDLMKTGRLPKQPQQLFINARERSWRFPICINSRRII